MKYLKLVFFIILVLLTGFFFMFISFGLKGEKEHIPLPISLLHTTSLISSDSSTLGHWEIVNKIFYDKIKKLNLKGDIGPAYLYYGVTLAGFFNDSFGVTVGPDDDVRYTTDRGKSWTKTTGELFCRHGLDIVDENIAWHGGNGGTRVSTDRCRTWRTVSPTRAFHNFLSFLDSKTGWAASPYYIQSTTDGGTSWHNIKLPTGIQLIAGINLRTEKEGYILESKGQLFITKDGAKSWKVHSIGLKTGEQIASSSISPMAAIRFFDNKHGMIVYDLLDNYEKRVWFALTRDGGKSWKRAEIKALQNQAYYLHLFLSKDGNFLTATINDFNRGKNESIVLHYQKP